MQNSFIPPEIRKFFEDENGKTILIKGEPGTGKSILALTLLKEICTRGNGIYLSTRIDPDMIYELFPWICDEIPAQNIVDATQSERPTKSAGMGPSAIGTSGIKPLKYTDVPEFLKAVYTRTEKLENPIVVIDSWDAVVSHTGFYKPEDRERLEHNMCDFARKAKLKVIFIAEYTEQRPLDYLVDGVIFTEHRTEEERRVRELTLGKLRGAKIKQPRYLYTLNEGIFKYFKNFESGSLNPAISDPIPDLSERRVSTGMESLDEVTGGYEKGSLTLFETGNCVMWEHQWLIYATIINFLNLGRDVILSDGVTFDLLRDKIFPFTHDSFHSNIKGVDIPHMNDTRREMDDKNKTVLWFFDLDKIEEERKEIELIISSWRGDAFLAVVKEGKTIGDLDHFVGSFFKIKMYSGALCIYGEAPRTEIYTLENDVSRGFPSSILTPIV